MNLHPVMFITCCLVIATATELPAAEASVVVDRSRLTLGDDFHVKIVVHKSAGKPLVQPPKAPGCRIELLGSTQASMPATNRTSNSNSKRQQGDSMGPLIDAIGKLERDTQRALQEHAASQGISGTGINQEAFDMLRATREQALEALRGPNSTEHQTVFRITPERAGILTLPSFIVETGGRTYLTKPIEVTVDEPAPAATSPPAAPRESGKLLATAPAAPPNPGPGNMPPPYAASELLGSQPYPGAWWPMLATVAIVPFGLLIGWACIRGWQRRRLASAPQRQQRQRVTTARRQLWQQLGDEADTEALATALTAYLRSRCTLPPGEVTPEEAARSLETAGVTTALAGRFAGLLDACSASRFAPGGLAVLEKDLATEVRDLVRQLERAER